MGLYSTAMLVWGIPVLAWDEDSWDEDRERYAATKFWTYYDDEEYGDWRTFDSELVIVTWGHYEDPDNKRGILSSDRVEVYRADCWTPTQIPNQLPSEMASDKVYSKANDAAREYELGVNFYGEAGWWLVTDFG